MENNKILIGVQFTFMDDTDKYKHFHIELYVLRDTTFVYLLSGIKYGLSRLADEDKVNASIYQKCSSVYRHCVSKVEAGIDGRQHFTNIAFTSFTQVVSNNGHTDDAQISFYTDDIYKPLCDLGFITSSRIIFDETGEFSPEGKIDTANIIEAFNPYNLNRIRFPEYNISTRQLWKFDESAVEVIPPSDPPKNPDQGLIMILLPSLMSVLVLLAVRSFFSDGGQSMLALSAATGASAAIATVIAWLRRKREFRKNLIDWKNQYQVYIEGLIQFIKNRQNNDTKKMHDLYPDILSLVNKDKIGIYSLNERIYSRSPQDEDFLTFRIGVSDKVVSKFEIIGENREVVFSEAVYNLDWADELNSKLRLYLREEAREMHECTNLHKLPKDLSIHFRYLKNAPLLYSLKNKGALGIVDHEVDNLISMSRYFVLRMILELCYYHSPENLQFIVFLQHETDWNSIDNSIHNYRFMPHFRGLFTDKSQFVFDNVSAGLVLGSLLKVISSRKADEAEKRSSLTPHIVLIVFEEHGLKEHAFAEYLPNAPEEGKDFVNDLGLSFVFAAKYKEYLPAYCDDIVDLNQGQMALTPRSDISDAKEFRYPELRGGQTISMKFFEQYATLFSRAFRFLSSIYYAHIAQNGNVPSSVGFYELFEGCRDDMAGLIRKNWGCGGGRAVPAVTSSLRVPIGKTETGLAFLDLHEKADGPHMLVAGTTGSGKTETVISYLLGLCVQYRPDELNLLLIDMKGGGFTKRIGHLPHVAGAVTDVDGDENETGAEYVLGRFLFAIKAEIKRRKLLFNKLHVDSIDAYIQACQDIDSHIEKKKISSEEAEIIRYTAKDEPLPHLILVVDEFTELKRFSSENNDIDYIKEITTIARVGRSLGFHIILISQNIEGAITDDIRINTNARLCLKVATRQASKDMIGTELAASPAMPGNGRAYLLIGTGSKFEYFQSGYSGAGVKEDIPVEIIHASKQGSYSSFYRSDRDNKDLLSKKEERKRIDRSKTQLEDVTEALCEVYNSEKEHLGKKHLVYMAPLPTCFALDKDHKMIDLSKTKDLSKEKDR